MIFTRSSRARRLVGCTALALSAGMLLSGTASAGTPAPRPTVEKPAPAAGGPAKRLVPDFSQSRAGATAEGLAAAGTASRFDVDRDGTTDIPYRSWGGRVYVAVSGPEEDSEITRGTSEFAKDIIPLGDMDLNGSGPEFLTVSPLGNLSLYGDATRTHASHRWSGAGWKIYNKIFTPGDISGDGRADVLARTPAGELYVYVSTGSELGPFHARQKIGNGWQYYDQLIGLGDSDGDGRGDFLARTPSGVLFYYGSTGSPYSVKPRKEVGYGWNAYNQVFGADDVNGDGIGDVLARGEDGTLWGYLGKGGGAFQARRQASAGAYWSGVPQIGGAGNVPALGKEGMLARDKAGSLYWYNSWANGKLTPRDHLVDGWGEANLFEVNDFDSDGISETLDIWQGHLYKGETDLGGGWGVYNQLAGPGDLNGDGSGDFVARDRNTGILYLYRTNASGTALHSRVKVGSGWGAYNRIVGSGDFSGDGLNDLIARAHDGTLYLYQGTGQAGYPFKPRVRIGGGWNVYPKLVAPGDITGDGKADLLAVNAGGELFRYTGTGEAGARALKPRVKIGQGYQIYNGLY